MTFKQIIGKLVLKIWGWKVELQGDVNNLDRCILVVGGHTHNSEFLLGIFAYWSLNKPLKVIIKDQHTKAWYGFLVKALGGVGIDRSQQNHLVKFVAQQFEKADFSLVITPEGTRKRVERWKKGFYYMALEAKVPLVLSTADFKKKLVYLGYQIPYEEIASTSYEDLLKRIETYYRDLNFTPKIPENWNPVIQ